MTTKKRSVKIETIDTGCESQIKFMRDEKQKLEAALKTVSHGTMGQIHEAASTLQYAAIQIQEIMQRKAA